MRLLPLALAAFLLLAPAASAQTAPNGDLAYHGYSAGQYDVYVQPADGGPPRNLTAGSGAFEGTPDWSPDGSRIVFASDRTGWSEIYVMNADGSGVRQLTRAAGDYDESWGPRFSPDGSKILYTFDPRMGSGGDTDLYAMDPDGTDKHNLTGRWESGLEYDDYAASWARDGSKIVFSAIRPGDMGGTWEIVTANPDGSGQRRLLGNHDHQRWVEYPSLSPDGEKILFMQAAPSYSDWEVWAMNADGSGQENLTQHPAGDDYPTWSQDGKRIFFTSNRGDGSFTDLYVMDYPAVAPQPVAGASSLRRRARASASATATPTRVLSNVNAPDFRSTAGMARVAGGVLKYTAGRGEANQLTVSVSGGQVRLRDAGSERIAPLAGCTAVSAIEVACGSPARVEADLRDGADRAANRTPVPLTARGGDGDDVLIGGSPADALSGEGGDDRLDGGRGGDTIAGGSGTDTVSYATRTARVSVWLDTARNDGETDVDGAAEGAQPEGDLVRPDVENAIGGSAADRLWGSPAVNVLEGRGGDDWLDGKLGGDTLIGGAGTDTADYAARTARVAVWIDTARNDGQADVDAAAEGDQPERDFVRPDVENVFGGSGDDTLVAGIANAVVNVLSGGSGADRLFTAEGTATADRALCGAGADVARTDPSDARAGCEGTG